MPKPDSNSDFALVAAAKDGDREAFSVLLQRHAAKVHAFLLAFVPPSEADDLMQETMLAAWRGLPTLQRPERVVPWLIGIARNFGQRRLGGEVGAAMRGLAMAGRVAGAGVGTTARAVGASSMVAWNWAIGCRQCVGRRIVVAVRFSWRFRIEPLSLARHCQFGCGQATAASWGSLAVRDRADREG
ncbi:MAG: RNA polymerase sigma factor [Planctomycetes bacterium]|nr:RNA polymerase sigma factor [Planctomycetota bacterium]MCP4770937.1 RNA polymerase sigma factor [Planctomycetota bacterium]MCP4861657.1 RNA polymerase sigma factor [Planctomycetota bacterium]